MDQGAENRQCQNVMCEKQPVLFVNRTISIEKPIQFSDPQVSPVQPLGKDDVWLRHQFINFGSHERLLKPSFDNSTAVFTNYQGGISPFAASYNYDPFCQDYNSYLFHRQLQMSNPPSYFKQQIWNSETAYLPNVVPKVNLPIGMPCDLQTSQSPQSFLKNCFNFEGVFGANPAPFYMYGTPENLGELGYSAHRMSSNLIESPMQSYRHQSDPGTLGEVRIHIPSEMSAVPKETFSPKTSVQISKSNRPMQRLRKKKTSSPIPKEILELRDKIKRLDLAGLEKLNVLLDHFYTPKITTYEQFPSATLNTLLFTIQSKITRKAKTLARRYLEFILFEWNELPDRTTLIDHVLSHCGL